LGEEKEPGNEILPDLDAHSSDARMESVRVSRPFSSDSPSVTPTLSRRGNTRLHGRYLLMGRMAWTVIAVMSVVCIVVSIPAEFARLQAVCPTGACPPGAFTPANVRELGAMGLSVVFSSESG
jgi:hypothetical protein